MDRTDQDRAVEVVRELPRRGTTGAVQCLVKRGDDFFVVSSVQAYSGFETLVFPANAAGDITDWLEVAGGRGMSRGEAIADLAQ